MARWTDIAQWRGPSPNITEDDQREHRGLVVHIAEGWYDGTISWQKNPSADVSSHFIVGRDGKIAQMVDTSDKAWAQRSGNPYWLSVECEGFTKGHKLNPGGWESLTAAQIDAIARILLKCHTAYGVPLQTASSATGKGLGHHSMGGTTWGHQDCPGNPIIAQKDDIVARAKAIKNGTTEEDSMELTDKIKLITGQDVGYSDTEWSVGFTLASTHYYVLQARNQLAADLKAARLREEAILAAVKGLDTKAVINAVNAAAAADAKRDAALLAEVQNLASGGATADEIVAKLAERLAQ